VSGSRDLARDNIRVVKRQERPAGWHRGEAGVREGLAQLLSQPGPEERVVLSPEDPHRAGELAELAGGVEQDARVDVPREADIAVRLADEVAAAGISDPVEALRQAVRSWLDICVEPEIHRIALIDGPSVLGWAHWREVCQRHVFGLVQGVVQSGIEVGRIRAQPARPLAHVLMGAGDEAALYVAEAADRTRARAEMIEVLDQLIAGITT
jgi:hypothetical protein